MSQIPISQVTPGDYVAFDTYVTAVVAEFKVQGYEAIAVKQEFGGNITPDGVNTAPNIDFAVYSWIVNIAVLNLGIMLSTANYRDFSAGDPIKEARRRIELAGGTLKTVIVIPQPKQDPGPVQGIPFEEPIGSGNYYKINPFGMKTSCRAPVTGLLTKVDPVIAIKGYIGSELGKQPPQSDETLVFVEGILGFMAKL